MNTSRKQVNGLNDINVRAVLGTMASDGGAVGAEERRKAFEKGNFHDGIPAITVICRGGLSKRTHKHTYSAYGGVGVILHDRYSVKKYNNI